MGNYSVLTTCLANVHVWPLIDQQLINKTCRVIFHIEGQRRAPVLFHLTKMYSVFANSDPLQTDTFRFSIFHSHHIQLSSNKFQSGYAILARQQPRMGHPLARSSTKGNFTIIKTLFFTIQNSIYIYIYICRILCMSMHAYNKQKTRPFFEKTP